MIKKFSGKSFISGVIVGSIMFSGITYAASGIKLIVDGKAVQSDVEPQIINGRTMVPARFLAEALGAKVEWDEANQTVVVISKEQQNYDIPGNVNPVFVFFKYLFTDPEYAQSQVDYTKTTFNADDFRDRVLQANLTDLKETGREDGKVEFTATIDVKLEREYVGSLKEGLNEMYFLVEKTGEMAFKIVAESTTPLIEDSEPEGDGFGKLTNETSILLVKDALNAYWHLMGGGEQKDGAEIQTFVKGGKEYRYLGENIDTWAELRGFLGVFYTEQVVQQMIQDAGIIEANGRLAQVNADGGSLLNYGYLQSEEIKSTETEAWFEFKFEIGDTTEFVPIQIAFKAEEKSGWKLNTTPRSIYQEGSK